MSAGPEPPASRDARSGRAFGRDFLWNSAANVLVRGLSGLSRLALVLAASWLSPEAFGRLGVALAAFEILRVACDAGLSVVAVRRFAQARGTHPVGRVIALHLALATLGFLAAPWIHQLVFGRSEPVLWVLGLALFTTLPQATLVASFQARLEMHRLVPASAAGALATAAVLAWCWASQAPAVAVAAALPAGSAVELVLTLAIHRRRGHGGSGLTLRGARSLLAESLPVMVGGLLVIAYLRLDTFLIEGIRGTEAVGFYTLPLRLTEPFTLLTSSAALSLYPMVAARGAPPWDVELRRRIARFLAVTGALCVAAAAALSLASAAIVGAFSDAYGPASSALAILAWTLPLKGLNAQLTALVNAAGRHALIAWIAGANLIVNLTLNLLLIPRYGVTGAAVSAVATEACGLLAQGWVSIRFFGGMSARD